MFAVWIDGLLYSTTNGTLAKARNLQASPQVAFTTQVDGVDIIVEGRAEFVTDETTLERVARAYRGKYGWPWRSATARRTRPSPPRPPARHPSAPTP